MKVFLDSDVVISSCISTKGAASWLIRLSRKSFYISDHSLKEILLVMKRLNLDTSLLDSYLNDSMSVVRIGETIQTIHEKYGAYVTDIRDAHIVAGAHISSSSFLITYNMRDYNREQVQRDYGILIYTPSMFLQYLRSIES